MAGNQRETKLTLRVEALGQEDLKSLQDGLTRLAKEGGDAAPEFQRLADEVGRLGEQAGTLAAFEKLAATTAELAAKQQSAAQASADLKARLDEQRASVAAAAAAQEAASKKYQEAKNELTDLGTSLKTLRAETDSAGKKTDEYKATVTALIGKQGELKKSLDDLRSARSAANQTLDEAEAKERKLEASYERSRTAIDKATTTLQQSSAALDGARAATDALGLSTDDVAASQAQLIAALNRTGAEADALQASALNAANYIEFWSRSLDELDRNLQETSRAAKAAATQIDNAFGTIGVRGAQELEAEIAQVRSAMDVLKNQAGLTGGALATAMSAGNAKIKELERELRAVTGALTTADKAANLFKNSMGQITAGNLVADAIGYLVNKVKELGQAFVGSIVQLDTFRRSLDAIYKNTTTTATQLDFLRKAASEAGVSVGGISNSFIKFSASMKSANVPIGESNALFQSLTRAAGTLGLEADRTSLALDALAQIASKGTVSMEELRQQLGDSIPGALSLTAKGLGITDAELVKLVESGNLAANDFFPAFTKGLKDIQGSTDGLSPAFERLKNSLTIFAQTAGDAGWSQILTVALKGLAAVLGAVTISLQAAFEGFSVLVRGAGILAGAITTLSNPMSALSDLWLESAGRMKVLTSAVGDAVFGMNDQAAAATAASGSVKLLASEAEGLTRTQQVLALATKLATDENVTAAGSYVQLSANIASMLSLQQAETLAREKSAKAAKEQGDTLIALAKLRGSETASLETAVSATANYLTASEAVLRSKQEELSLLELQLSATAKKLEADGKTTEEISKQTEELQKKIAVMRGEVEQSKASTDAARQSLETARLQAQVYRDNSARAEEYRDRVAQLTKYLQYLEERERAGVNLGGLVVQVRKDLAAATALYNDTIADTIAKIRLEGQEKLASLQISKSALESEVALLNAKAQSARASGDNTRAVQLETEAKKKQIEIDKLAIEIKKIELEIDKQVLQQKLQALQSDDAQYENKKRLLDLQIKMNDAALKGVTAQSELIKIRERDLTQSTLLGDTLGKEVTTRGTLIGSVNSQSDAMEKLMMKYTLSADYSKRQIELLEEEVKAAEKAAEAYRKKWNIDKDGFTLDANGQRMQQSAPTGRYVYDTAKAQGLSEQQALALMDKYFQNGEAVLGSQGAGLLGPSKDWFTVVNEAINEAVIENARSNAAKPTTPTTATPTPTAPTTGQVITINVKTPNGSKSVKVASQSDAAALESILREFETAAGTAA